jgi:hypothetical protein
LDLKLILTPNWQTGDIQIQKAETVLLDEKGYLKSLIIGFFLVPTRWRGNAVSTRQRRHCQHGTLARPDWVPTQARGNQKKMSCTEDYFLAGISQKRYEPPIFIRHREAFDLSGLKKESL